MDKKVDLDKKLEYKGYWYLPSYPENAIAGVVTYLPNEKIVLELFGGFNDSILELFAKAKEESIIYGNTSDAKEITLVRCYHYSTLNFNAQFPIVRYSCDYMIIGKHIRGLDEKCNYWANAIIPELTLWCHPAAIEMTFWHKKGEEKISKTSLSFSTLYQDKANTIQETHIDDNTSINLIKTVSFDGSTYSLTPKIEQYTYLELQKQNVASIKDLLSDIFMYEQFLSIATLNVVKCSSITLFDKELYQKVHGQKYYRPIEIIHPFYDRNFIKHEVLKPPSFLFKYMDIKDFYPILLKKWYNEPLDIAPIRAHLINSLEQKRIYGSIDFLNIIQAIEGFWWRFRDTSYRQANNIGRKKRISLNTILNQLIKEHNGIKALNRKNIDIKSVVDSRNYYSHFVNKSTKPHTLDGWELVDETKKLRLLLLCCVLTFMGFEETQIDKVLESSHSSLLK